MKTLKSMRVGAVQRKISEEAPQHFTRFSRVGENGGERRVQDGL